MFTIQEGAAETFRDQQGFSDPDSEEDKLRSQNWTFYIIKWKETS